MNTKHTPGPWKYSAAVQSNGPNYFAVTNGKWGATSIAHAFNEQDARLIAAAPEMLGCLEQCARFLEHRSNDSAAQYNLEKIRALIARIEGVGQ